MIVIADSGSTKTDWRLIKESGEVLSFNGVGLNPYFHESTSLEEGIRMAFGKAWEYENIKSIFFYGAGCSAPENVQLASDALGKCFTNASVEVHHDLLGAARALCQNKRGLVGILGTGSNSCLYDGVEVVDNIPALGFVLGDEGSGAHMGKQLIRDYLLGELPVDLSGKMDKKYGLKTFHFLDAIYNKPCPNEFIAGFTRFLGENIDHEYAKVLVANSFRSFFENQILKYETREGDVFNCVGSIGHIFQDILKVVVSESGLIPGKFIKSPIEDMVLFHKNLY